MLNLVLIGLNHQTANLDLRQLAAFNGEQLHRGLKRLSALPGILESMILSTCNRVEVISHVDNRSQGIASIETFLSDSSGIPLSMLRHTLYRYTDDDAVRHLFRVASSLDSMILGEAQILGQVKSFYQTAVGVGTIGSYLNRLLQAAFRTAKRVRSETSIGAYPVSVSSAAIELVQNILGDLQKKSILIVGAGKMGQAAIRYLADIGAKNIYLTNRSPETAHQLAARFNLMTVPFVDLEEWAARADIVFTSTGASEILIDQAMVQRIMDRRRSAPIVFIDVSVPRNIDPKVGTINNVFCYDIDDLKTVVGANLEERTKATAAAEKIIDQEVQAFCTKLKSLKVVPAVRQLQSWINEICRAELQRSLRRTGLRDPRQIQELEAMVSRIAGKIAHPLIMSLRNGQDILTGSGRNQIINHSGDQKDLDRDY